MLPIGFLSALASPAWGGDDKDILLVSRMLLDNLLMSIIMMFVRGALILVGGMAIFVATMADLLLDVGVAFGPLLVVLYPVLPSTGQVLVFFLIGAAMTKPVAAFVIGGAFSGLTAAISTIQPLNGDFFGNTSTAFGLLMALFLVNALVMSIPSIVSGLFGGMAIGSSGAALRMAGGVAGGVGKLGAGGLKKIGGAISKIGSSSSTKG